jgi:phosphatidylglycerophosphate synthase
MRKADIATAFRIVIIPVIVYTVLLKTNPIIPVALFIAALVSDGIDGFFALSEISNGKIGFGTYIKYAMGDESAVRMVSSYKPKIEKVAKYGPRMDVAGDRMVEYSLWMLFVYTKTIPFFVILLILAVHSVADAFMGGRGTSSKTKTRFARVVYTSKWSRLVANVLKALTFSYLMLVFISGWNLVLGYALTALLAGFVTLRGTAEIYECLQP